MDRGSMFTAVPWNSSLQDIDLPSRSSSAELLTNSSSFTACIHDFQDASFRCSGKVLIQITHGAPVPNHGVLTEIFPRRRLAVSAMEMTKISQDGFLLHQRMELRTSTVY